MRIILILGILLIVASLFGQNDDFGTYQYPKLIPPSYQLFYQTDSILTDDTAVEKLEKKDRIKYFDNYRQQLKYMAESGLIYFDWKPVEKYLNDLLHKLTPDSLKNKTQSKVFVKKEITNNAVSMPNGHIYINVGLLANLKSEAALSFIIAHELAHYLKQHHLKNYKQTLKNSGNSSAYYRFTHNNKHLEIEADEMALNLLCEQNIPIDDAMDVFKLMESKGKILNLNSMRRYFVEKQVKRSFKKQREYKSDSIFNEISILWKNEFLNVLLQKNYYQACIEFGLGMLNENNFSKAVYFTAEAIRRYLMLNKNNAEKSVETVIAELKMESNISIADSLDISTMQKNLTTVFEELTSISNKQKDAELYFTAALHNLYNGEKQSLIEEDLKNYLNKENVSYALLAKDMLKTSNKPKQETADQPVILIDLIKSFYQPSSKYQIDFENQNSLNTTVNPKLKQWLFAKYTGCKIIFIEDLINTELNKAVKLQNFFNTQDSILLDTTTSIFSSQPNAFELFSLLETTEIKYLKIETKEGSKLENNNVFNPLSFPSKISYLVNEKKQFSIKKIAINNNGNISVEENTFNGKLKLNKITNYFEELID